MVAPGFPRNGLAESIVLALKLAAALLVRELRFGLYFHLDQI